MAINFSGGIKDKLLELQEQLRIQTSKGIFTRFENFHLTLAFLGETPAEKLNLLFRLMEEFNSPPVDIVFNHIGCFTHSRKELWWIGSDPESPGSLLLRGIHERLLSRLEEGGFAVDKRPFNAHITLAREIKHPLPIVLEAPELTVRADCISLMKSEHIRGILTYTEIQKVVLSSGRR